MFHCFNIPVKNWYFQHSIQTWFQYVCSNLMYKAIQFYCTVPLILACFAIMHMNGHMIRVQVLSKVANCHSLHENDYTGIKDKPAESCIQTFKFVRFCLRKWQHKQEMLNLAFFCSNVFSISMVLKYTTYTCYLILCQLLPIQWMLCQNTADIWIKTNQKQSEMTVLWV